MRLSLMRLKMVRASDKEAGIERRSRGCMRTMSAASMAISVPEERDMPISAVARAGESLIPSPTIATRCGLPFLGLVVDCREEMMDCFSEGDTDAWISDLGM